MLENNSVDHVFRFIQLRPPGTLGADQIVLLRADTAFALKMSGSPLRQRIAIAHDHLDSARASIESLFREPWTAEMNRTAQQVAEADGSVRELRDRISETMRNVDREAALANLSDYLLAAMFADSSSLGLTRYVAQLYRATAVVLDTERINPDTRLTTALRSPLSLPPALSGSNADHLKIPQREAGDVDGRDSRSRPARSWRMRIQNTTQEVLSLYRSQVVQRLEPRNDTTKHTHRRQSLTLEPQTAARLSRASRKVLGALEIDPAAQSLIATIAQLEGATETPPDNSEEPANTPASPASALSALAAMEVRASGIADLLIVKQHLKAYRRTDIAHVENVIAGERKERVHRNLERTEQTFVTEREHIEEKESELQTAERFELNQETEKTIQRDQQLGFGLTVSGKYGPTVEFSSNVEAEISQSTEESIRSAVTYAKDVMERSVQRITDRVREEQIVKVIRETEETNTHELHNETPNHIVGIYQFLEKEYECQVFNYGIRQMFDFMVPEPASYIWHLEGAPGSELSLPPQPPKLSDHAASAAEVNEGNYLSLAAMMGARGVEPPPPLVKFSSVSLKHGESGDEGGQPRSVIDKEIPIPDGYVPWVATARPLALTDDELTLAVTVGIDTQVWSPRGGAVQGLGGLDLGTTELDFVLVTSLSSLEDPQSKLAFHVVAYESNTYSVVLNVMFARTDHAYHTWQLATYDTLTQADREQQAKYAQMVADARARADAEAARTPVSFDEPPSEHLRVVRGELKKHCLSIVTQQWYDAPNGVADSDPPTFDLPIAASRGVFIRFFEQAFEWDQLQYVCYPYFWARKGMWSDRFRRREIDPVFLDFLQAGAARVVVPVRPGFEEAVLYFLETLDATGTGIVWNGAGSPPPIHSPLYVSIVKEIQERTGAPQGEIPVGEPWSTILPTPLVILRPDASLPEWNRQSPQTWEWDEV